MNYFMGNISRISKLSNGFHRQKFDICLELGLLYIFIGLELILKASQSVSRNIHCTKHIFSLRRIANLPKIFKHLSFLLSLCLLTLISIILFFKKMAFHFKLSYLKTSFTVVLKVYSTVSQIYYRDVLFFGWSFSLQIKNSRLCKSVANILYSYQNSFTDYSSILGCLGDRLNF